MAHLLHHHVLVHQGVGLLQEGIERAELARISHMVGLGVVADRLELRRGESRGGQPRIAWINSNDGRVEVAAAATGAAWQLQRAGESVAPAPAAACS